MATRTTRSTAKGRAPAKGATQRPGVAKKARAATAKPAEAKPAKAKPVPAGKIASSKVLLQDEEAVIAAPAPVDTATQGRARTVVFIHGLGNKPPAEVLRCQWDTALFGRPMGERTRMAYWVNRGRYPVAEPGNCDDRDRGPGIDGAGQRYPAALGVAPTPADLRLLADGLADSTAERERLHQLLDELDAHSPAAGASGTPGAKGLVDVVNRALLKLVSAALLQDTHDFFYVPARKAAMRESLLQRLRAGGGPFVVIAHSQGSLIAYDVLRELDPAAHEVALFITLGSPLGLPAIRSMFKQATKTKKLPFPPCVRRWINVADTLDFVALDADLRDDIADARGRFSNLARARINPDWRSNPHSGSGYLSIPEVRGFVRDAVGIGFDQPVANTVLLKDLSDRLEAHGPDYRHEVLVELDTIAGIGSRVHARWALVARIRELAGATTGLKGTALDDAIDLEDTLQRYVAARLTRFEVEALRGDYAQLSFRRLWRDADKRALVYQSRTVVHADAAQSAYHAMGARIGWAVLDTGIAAGHPHFHDRGKRDCVAAQYDCTVRGAPKRLLRGDRAFNRLDRDGHGTHVAGIIAGRCRAPLPGDGPDAQASVDYVGIAPEARLYGIKVLDDQGKGRDSWIIKGVQQVADLNDEAGELVIHGINLSLGGFFDAQSYGCGFTPLCNELRRLWRQGVLVVLAAGNEGLAYLVQQDGEAYPMNMDLTIGDPANLEEAIAVGSVHKWNPHAYGVSYFSSRGPTADGRVKPDVVAPGEKIVSAHYDYRVRDPATWMVEMSGTSMAAPHVSGVLAAFLSARREFIGFPDRTKAYLLDNCTDLQRDRYLQGRGVPNLMRMLTGT